VAVTEARESSGAWHAAKISASYRFHGGETLGTALSAKVRRFLQSQLNELVIRCMSALSGACLIRKGVSIMFKRKAIRGRLPSLLFLAIAALVVGVVMASPSQAAGSVVNVSLWDKGAEMAMATDLGFPAAGKDMSKATMGIAVSVDTVKAGEITFEVLNSSKDVIHEVIITRLRDLTMLFPYNSSESRVDEDKMADILGEVSELEPSQTGALRLDLKPGKYLLFCNIPGHFMAGMWTIFTVS